MKKIKYGVRQGIVKKGKYKGREYVIYNRGLAPCAYISCPEAVSKTKEDYDFIPCHGGVTYLGKNYWEESSDKIFIGWDYCHSDLGDYVFNARGGVGTNKYATKMIISELKAVINYLNVVENNKKKQ